MKSVTTTEQAGFRYDVDGKRYWNDYEWWPTAIVKSGRPALPFYADQQAKQICQTEQGSDEFHLALAQPKNKDLASQWAEWYFKSDGSNWDELMRDCFFIHDKEGAPCRLDIDDPRYQRAQRYYMHKVVDSMQRTGSFRGVVLKARQWGCSMETVGILLCMMMSRQAFQCMSAADDAPKSKAMLERMRQMINDMPAWIKPETKYDSQNMVQLAGWPKASPLNGRKNQSWIQVITADARSFGRSFTLQGFHASEVAFWEQTTAKKAHTGVTQAIPATAKGVFVVWESTANGFGSIHAEQWEKAERGENFHTPIFVPWFWIGEYQVDRDQCDHLFPKLDYDSFCEAVEHRNYRKATLDSEEQKLVSMFGLSGPQLLWRRYKIAELNDDVDRFKQENPATPDEAFIRDGAQVFDAVAIHDYMTNKNERGVIAPIAKMNLVCDDDTEIDPDKMQLIEAPDGIVSIWELPQKGHEYVVFVDPSEGTDSESERKKDGDNTAVVVLDRTSRAQVAAMAGRFPPDMTADYAFKLGYEYNRAVVAIENNAGFGSVIIIRGKELSYEALYTSKVYDSSTRTEVDTLGWRTTPKTRSMAFSTARGEIKKRRWKIRDMSLLKELGAMVYKRTPTGKVKEMPAGGHDDRCLAFVCGLQVCVEMGAAQDPSGDSAKASSHGIALAKNLTAWERKFWEQEIERAEHGEKPMFTAL